MRVGPTATWMSGGVKLLVPNERAPQPVPITGDASAGASRIANLFSGEESIGPFEMTMGPSRADGAGVATFAAPVCCGGEAAAVVEAPTRPGTAMSNTAPNRKVWKRLLGIPATPPPAGMRLFPNYKGPDGRNESAESNDSFSTAPTLKRSQRGPSCA